MARLTPAVLRALDILELLAESPQPLTAMEIVERSGIPRSSAHEILATLAARQYLQKTRSGGFRLGVGAFDLGRTYTRQFDMLQAANEVAREVSAECGETISVALLEGSEVFYLAKAELEVQVPMASKIGVRLPASSTALGKALLAGLPLATLRALYPEPDRLPGLSPNSIRTLAELEVELAEVRVTGISHEREESGHGICCSAAQVKDITGQVVAALSVSVPVARYDDRPRVEWDELVAAGAGQLSRVLGYMSSHID